MANKTTKSSKSSRSQATPKSRQVKHTLPSLASNSETVVSQKSTQIFTQLKLNRKTTIIAVVVIGLAALLYIYRGLFVAATVNGQPITRIAVIQELEHQGGKQTLNSLVTKQLILQEANKRKIVVTDAEVDSEIKKIEANFKKQGQTLSEVLTSQNLTVESLKEQVRIQKIIEKMLAKEVSVTDKEIKDYMDKNKESLPENTKESDIKEQLRQQKLNEKFQALLAQLQKDAKIRTFVSY